MKFVQKNQLKLFYGFIALPSCKVIALTNNILLQKMFREDAKTS